MTARTASRTPLKHYARQGAIFIALTALFCLAAILACAALMGAAALALFLLFMALGASPSTWPPLARDAAILLVVSTLAMVLSVGWLRTRRRTW